MLKKLNQNQSRLKRIRPLQNRKMVLRRVRKMKKKLFLKYLWAMSAFKRPRTVSESSLSPAETWSESSFLEEKPL